MRRQPSMSSRKGVKSETSMIAVMATPNAAAISSRPVQPRPVRSETSRTSSAAPPYRGAKRTAKAVPNGPPRSLR